MSEPLIRVVDLAKDYVMGSNVVPALRGVTLDIAAGEFVAVMGPSGSGKSTFMNLLGCLDHPSAGRYSLDGQEVSALSGDELAAVRNRKLGFVFQHFNLLARTTALENVELPLIYRGSPQAERRALALDALERVGLKGREHHTSGELSGGQQQRVAIARAIVTNPALLLADEPTGNLDTRTSREIMDLVTSLNRDQRITVVMVTHEDDIAAHARRVIRFVDGRVESDRARGEAG